MVGSGECGWNVNGGEERVLFAGGLTALVYLSNGNGLARHTRVAWPNGVEALLAAGVRDELVHFVSA